MNQNEQQQKTQQYQLLQSQLEALKDESEGIDDEIQELENTKETIDKLEDLEEDDEVAMPIGSGAFAFGKLDKIEKVLINLGSDALAKKTLSEAKDILDDRKEEISSVKNTVEDNIERVTKRLQELGPEMQKMQGR